MSTEVQLFKNGVPSYLKSQELNDVTSLCWVGARPPSKSPSAAMSSG